MSTISWWIVKNYFRGKVQTSCHSSINSFPCFMLTINFCLLLYIFVDASAVQEPICICFQSRHAYFFLPGQQMLPIWRKHFCFVYSESIEEIFVSEKCINKVIRKYCHFPLHGTTLHKNLLHYNTYVQFVCHVCFVIYDFNTTFLVFLLL